MLNKENIVNWQNVFCKEIFSGLKIQRQPMKNKPASSLNSYIFVHIC